MTPPPVADLEPTLVLLALALVAVTAYELLRVRTGEASATAWDRFQLFAGERGLPEDEVARCSAWARRAGLANPALVLSDRATFDRFARDAVHDLDGSGHRPGSPGRRDELDRLAALRRRLGHVLAPGDPTVSSVDLVPGVRVTLRPDAPPSGTVAPGRFVVRAVDEEAVELAPIDGDPAEKAFYDALAPGKGAWAVFGLPGEATFRFRTRVLERPGVALPALVLLHGDFLLKEERRKTPRVVHRVSIKLASAPGAAADGEAVDGETVDLSWGGLGVVVSVGVPRGARYAVSLPLEREGEAVPVTVRVVGCSAREGAPGFFVNAQFVDLTPAARTRLQVFLGAGRHKLRVPAAAPAAP